MELGNCQTWKGNVQLMYIPTYKSYYEYIRPYLKSSFLNQILRFHSGTCTETRSLAADTSWPLDQGRLDRKKIRTRTKRNHRPWSGGNRDLLPAELWSILYRLYTFFIHDILSGHGDYALIKLERVEVKKVWSPIVLKVQFRKLYRWR